MRIIINICSLDLQKSKEFYLGLFDLHVKYDSDWFVLLGSIDYSEIEYGLIQQGHELIPKEYHQKPNGMYVTFVVADVDLTYQKALDRGITILQEPRNEFYGQRRFLIQDPSACLLDVCSPYEL